MFNPEVNVILPLSDVGVDWYNKGWVCFYYYPSEVGMKFPFSNLAQNLLTVLNVSSAESMLMTWRILAYLDVVEEICHLGMDVNVISYSYVTKKFKNYRYELTTKKKYEAFILNLDIINVRGWKRELFVEKSSLIEEGSYLRDKWSGEYTISFACSFLS